MEYFTPGADLPPSFDAAAARITADITEANVQAPTPFCSTPPAATPLSAEPLTLTQLMAFWKNPARAYLKALQIENRDDEADDAALDDPPLHLDGLQAYAVRAAALTNHLSTNGSAVAGAASSRLSADRALPPGELGVLTWEWHDREIAPLADALKPLLKHVQTTTIDFTLNGGTRLTGELQLAAVDSAEPWVLLYRPSNYAENQKYQLEAFISTAAATVQLGRPVFARVIGLDFTTPKDLPVLSLEDANHLLDVMVLGYHAGLERPLSYAPGVSDKLAKALLNDVEQEIALQQAIDEWSREAFDDKPAGEGLASAAALAWRDCEPFAPPHDQQWIRWARAIAAPMAQWWNTLPPATFSFANPPAPVPFPARSSSFRKRP